MKLTEKPQLIQWPRSHYVFVEKTGPFLQTAPAAWQELHAFMDDLKRTGLVTGAAALYRLEPEMVYRAGLLLKERPAALPAGLRYDEFPGGRYAQFTLTGSYAQLPEACGKVFAFVKEQAIPTRDAYFIEHYVNDPSTTPEAELLTGILIPTT